MRDLTRFTPPALLAVGCLLLSGMRSQQKVPSLVPMRALSIDVPDYGATRDTIISDAEQKVAGMSDYVLRYYQRPGGASTDYFSVYVGYYDYQVQGKTIHSPKNCLPGAGWEQLKASVQPVQVAGQTYPVNRYLLSNKGQQALVYYWYQGRGRVEANEYKVKYNLLHDAALYGRTEEALVRIVVPLDARAVAVNAKPVYDEADSLAIRVAQRLVPAVTRALPTSPST